MKLVVYLVPLAAPASRSLALVHVYPRANPHVLFYHWTNPSMLAPNWIYAASNGALSLSRPLEEGEIMRVRQGGKWLQFANLGGVIESLG